MQQRDMFNKALSLSSLLYLVFGGVCIYNLIPTRCDLRPHISLDEFPATSVRMKKKLRYSSKFNFYNFIFPIFPIITLLSIGISNSFCSQQVNTRISHPLHHDHHNQLVVGFWKCTAIQLSILHNLYPAPYPTAHPFLALFSIYIVM